MASLVLCVGPLTILGAIQNGPTATTNSTRSMRSRRLRGAPVHFGVRLRCRVLRVDDLVYQGAIAQGASALRDNSMPPTVALKAAGCVLILGVGFRLLDPVPVHVADRRS